MRACIACGGELYQESLYELNNMPSGAQIMPNREELQEDSAVSLQVCQCKYCGLVQIPMEPVDYYRNAIRVGNLTITMVELRKKEFVRLVNDFQMFGKKVIEIGCSTGEYVELMNKYGIDGYGLEYSEEFCRIAEERGIKIFRGYIENEDYCISDFLFDGFTCYNFLEHQPNPVSFLRGVYHNLAERAYGIVTVPSFNYMIENAGLYETIRDHISYFTKDTFYHVLYQSGFEILEISTINHDTLQAVVRKRSQFNLKQQKIVYEELVNSINQEVISIKKQNKKIAVWGASHQCFTVLSGTELGKNVEYIIDSSPLKQGRYAPVTHLKIVKPDFFFTNEVDVIIIMAPGYAKEIKETIVKLYGTKVKIGVLFADKLFMEE